MVDDATAKYLRDNIMTLNGQPVLSRALAEMAVAQPRDGVAFLAQWLKVFAEQEEAKAWREKEEALLKDERSKTQQILEAQSAKRKVQEQAKKDLEDLFDGFLNKMNDEQTQFQAVGPGDGHWQELVDVVKKTCGVQAVYLASLEEEGLEGAPEGPALQYDCASGGSEWMTETILPTGTGVTWGVLEDSPTDEAFVEPEAKKYYWRPAEELLPAPEPAEGEEPVERPRLKNYPVHVPCVTDVDNIHYFDMTRLGAYLAVPLVYNSYYTADAMEDAIKFNEEKKAEATARKEAEEAKETAEAAGEEIPEELKAKLEEFDNAEPKEMDLRTKVTKKVLCLDTLGTNTQIDPNQIPQILALCNAVAGCKSRTEQMHVDGQAHSQIDDELRTQQEEQLKDVREAIEQADEEERTAAEAEAEEEEDKVVVQKKYAYTGSRQIAEQRRDMITDLKNKWVVASTEVCNTVLAAAMLLGYDKAQVYPRRKSVLQWEKLKHVLSDQLIDDFAKMELATERKGLKPEHKLSYIKGLVPTLDDDAKARDPCMRSPGFGMLLNLVQAAVQYRTAYLDSVKAAYNRRKTVAEEAGEEFKETAPQELDDDQEEG
eukprot:TRINITY_DN21483_c0_g1_i1.p1 TRINITY_DN21483_c0_g1~~TRINITY_DN21483_c0_g1_i1.p1  ORF type:complete len:600 (-),score=237.76 TRINITY_DN21483_c0_g1_i1:162-1961(-)